MLVWRIETAMNANTDSTHRSVHLLSYQGPLTPRRQMAGASKIIAADFNPGQV
jgi:hypothetical protein